jgi:hypothetical protein
MDESRPIEGIDEVDRRGATGSKSRGGRKARQDLLCRATGKGGGSGTSWQYDEMEAQRREIEVEKGQTEAWWRRGKGMAVGVEVLGRPMEGRRPPARK